MNQAAISSPTSNRPQDPLARLDMPRAAVIPRAAADQLAAFRTHADLRYRIIHEAVWLFWSQPNRAWMETLLAVAGARFFVPQSERWHVWGESLPTSEVPDSSEARPLDGLVIPGVLTSIPASEFPIPRERLQLVPDTIGKPRPISAMLVELSSLARWAEQTIGTDLARFRAAISRDRVILRGRDLPLIGEEVRFWGERLLLPLCWTLEPTWDERTLLELWQVDASEIVLLQTSEVVRISLESFQPLSLGGLRLEMRSRGRS
ncbi:hypothetical protein [Tuwongella immobilis]|uniref:MoxR-vWA-beta-propeller ternary system domain-containing protein n=1 Tax=Tuwongella immobilis TaxID=692036 RepID=A0A6C2YIS1_9BACT|nr:hypothetical protein [Tuwongella immobilis]VIP01033.1 Uncharacterized protein OS=Singulisphaera acidiphila (strain ATCC BAA-1392 / DSM 18658 / VKM B-2454 / MOB10) GN=Sinac_2119 PE=4 SV=1 [Tuwongella immobilis]VTR97491.1 Uncharacterized protein OS=Singulisphaera acidiphila (strain ATCC BAA-1392 / DSM 18658 / VKM B-2454 / MOB10) GN=Sinac_2119 PE=4 SV=1 [Tuwongella immobilis]